MKVLAVYNIKGGVGKTSAAVNLAWVSAARGARTLLWDLDPQGAATFLLRVRPKVEGGARGLLAAPDAVERSIRASDYERLDLLPADFSYRKLERRLDGRKPRCIARLLAPLAGEYDRLLIDCAPGVTLVAEEVFAAADALLIPTIPTPLSLRTLAKLLGHLKGTRREGRPLLLPFFSMVDRRKALHREVCAYAEREGLGFIGRGVPYASPVERMATRREPLGAFAGSSAAMEAYGELWDEVTARLADGGEGGSEPTRRGVRGLLQEAEGGVVAGRRKARPSRAEGGARERDAPGNRNATRSEGGEGVETEFKLRLAGEGEMEALRRALPRGGAPASGPVRQVNHFFDGAGGELRRAGLVLRVREEDGRFTLTAKGALTAGAGDGLAQKPEEEVSIAPEEAGAVLGGERSPLELLAARLAPRSSELVWAMSRALGDAPLERIGSFSNDRLRAGPLVLPGPAGGVEVVLELDRTLFPGDRVDYELEVELDDPARSDACRAALGALFERAGIPWRPSTSKPARFFELLGASTPGAARGKRRPY